MKKYLPDLALSALVGLIVVFVGEVIAARIAESEIDLIGRGVLPEHTAAPVSVMVNASMAAMVIITLLAFILLKKRHHAPWYVLPLLAAGAFLLGPVLASGVLEGTAVIESIDRITAGAEIPFPFTIICAILLAIWTVTMSAVLRVVLGKPPGEAPSQGS